MSRIDPASLRDPSRCPDCGALLPPTPAACPTCGLPLQGPLVERLWRLSLQAADVLDQRRSVIASLRERADAPAGAGYGGWGGATAPPTSPTDWEQPAAGPGLPPAAPTWPPPGEPWAADPDKAGHRRESVSPRQIQHLLLGLGVLLVAVAALIFAVVAWHRVGIGGRTAILSGLTLAAGSGSVAALRRELGATAESLAVLTVALLLLDAFGVREYDLGNTGDVEAGSYWAAVLALLAALGVAVRTVLPLRTPLWTAAVGAQLPLLVLGHRLGASWFTAGLLVQGTAALAAIRRVPPAFPLAVGGGLAWLGGGASTVVLAYDLSDHPDDPHVSTATGVTLLALGAVLAVLLAIDLRHLDPLFLAPAAVATAAALAALHVPMERAWTHDSATAGGVGLLSIAAVAVIALPAAAARWRPGPLAALGVGGVLAVADVAVPTGRALSGPWHWIDDPWSRSIHGNARELLGRPWPHHGTAALGLALLTADAALVAWRLRGTRIGTGVAVAAGALATATAVVLPVATKAPYLLAVLGLVITGGVLLAVAARLLPTPAVNPAGAAAAALVNTTATATAGSAEATTATAPTEATAPPTTDASAPANTTSTTAAAPAPADTTTATAAPADATTAAAPTEATAPPTTDASAPANTTSTTADTMGLGLAAAGAVALSLGLVWSLAARTATVGALLAVIATAGALRLLSPPRLRPLAAALGVGALAAEAGVLTRVADHPGPAAGGIAVIAASSLAVAAHLLPDRLERLAAQAAAAIAAVLAFTAIGDDGGWASIGLLAAGVAAALIALLDQERRTLGWIAGLLLSVSSWVRLAASNVETPEAYTVPPAIALLAVGRLTRDENRSSWRSYGPGLSVGLVPSLFACAGDDGLTRPLLLGATALTVLLVGVRAKLQAPLGLGGAVLAIDALIQLGPYAAEVPRWVSVGLAGAVLLALGATFERRLRDLRRWADRFADLG